MSRTRQKPTFSLIPAAVAAAILGSAASLPALAQTTPAVPDTGANPIPPTTPPGKISPNPIPSPDDTKASDPSLSQKLDQNSGVITPPKGVDPGIVEKPPGVAAPMPVIPPPGTPQNQPNVQPK